MQSSLSPVEQGILYNNIRDLVLNNSKIIKENYDGTSDKFFTPIMMENAISEALGFICDYIYRPDRYVMMNPTIHYIWKDLIIDLLIARYNAEAPHSSGGGSGSIEPTSVKQLKQGDTTIILKDEVKSSTGHTLNLDDTFKNYKARLNRYRRPI